MIKSDHPWIIKKSPTTEPDDDDGSPNNKEMFWDTAEIYQLQGFWHRWNLVGPANAFRASFQPSQDDVVVLASSPKTGTTWLKALAHCILFRDDGEGEEEDVLTKINPQLCAPTFEIRVYTDDPSYRLGDIDKRRLFHTHLPYNYLPDSIKKHTRGCNLVYIARDPKDTLISQWHFFNKILLKGDDDEPFSLERAVESFCAGKIIFGPYWDHVLEYWEESKRFPDKVMFIKYEDLHRDPKSQVRRLASFMGRPFGEGEEEEVEKVIWRSSFDRLKNLEVNRAEQKMASLMKNSYFFRRGEVGDWRNYLTLEMAERIDGITRVKFQDTGLHLGDEEAI